MQMYLVDFQTHFENLVDRGKALVCASDSNAASEMVIQILELPRSRTVCNVQRIKPSLYELTRQETKTSDRKPSNRNLGLPQETKDYNLQISAAVSGTDEKHAMRRLAGSLIHKSKNQPGLDRHTKKLMVDCNLIEPEKRQLKAMEQVELYKPKTFIGGSERYAKGTKNDTPRRT